ncbi:SRPBCC family protein [Brevibacillus sp. SYSU BS000544]|uniref:SRPBCC family protein n=1 Tax=Brevibacillus sp. SYSU BS000544 TaxID=3416443 RepID=UPI003CE49E1A
MTEHNTAFNNTSNEKQGEFVITRTFDAPRELVFRAWTDAENLKQWWGPKGFSIIIAAFDLRPDGVFHYHLQSPDGLELWGKFVYREITAPEKLVYVSSFSDKEANIVGSPFSPTWPLEVLNTLTLVERDNKTILTLKGYPLNANKDELKTFVDMHASMQQGFSGTFDQLEDFLAKA